MASVSMVERVTYRVLDGTSCLDGDVWLEAAVVTFLARSVPPVDVAVSHQAYHVLQMGLSGSLADFLHQFRARLQPTSQDSDLLVLSTEDATLRVPRPPLRLLSTSEDLRLALLLAYQALRCDPFQLTPSRSAEVVEEIGDAVEEGLFVSVLRGGRPGLVDVQAVFLRSGMGWFDSLEAARLVTR